MSVPPEHDPDPYHERTLFVLFPKKWKDKQAIMDLHHGIEQVKRSGKRSGRWFHLRFETEELADEARKALHKKKVGPGRLIVAEKTKKQPVDLNKKKRADFNVLHAINIPKCITKSDLRSTFNTCRTIVIKPQRSSKKFNAYIIMRTHEEALELFADKESHKVNGIPLTIKFPTSYYTYLQNAQKESEAVNKSEVLGVETMETEVKEENSHNGSDANIQVKATQEHLYSPVVQDISEDDEMEG